MMFTASIPEIARRPYVLKDLNGTSLSEDDFHRSRDFVAASSIVICSYLRSEIGDLALTDVQLAFGYEAFTDKALQMTVSPFVAFDCAEMPNLSFRIRRDGSRPGSALAFQLSDADHIESTQEFPDVLTADVVADFLRDYSWYRSVGDHFTHEVYYEKAIKNFRQMTGIAA